MLVKLSSRQSIPLKPATVIGKSPECDVQLTEATASRRHAQLLLAVDGAWLEDLGSTNGTFVNGTRITGKVHLNFGDRLRFDVEEFGFLNSDQRIDVLLHPAFRPMAPSPKVDSSGIHPVEQVRKPAAVPVGTDSGVYKRPGAWADPDFPEFDKEKTRFMDPERLKATNSVPALSVRTVIDGPHLQVVSGMRAGLTVKLIGGESGPREWIVGSKSDSDVEIADSGVSEIHAKIVNDGRRWKVIDQMSANGTYVNGKRSNVSYLSPGDRVSFGPVECVFQIAAGGGGKSVAVDLRSVSSPRRGPKARLIVGAVFAATVLALFGLYYAWVQLGLGKHAKPVLVGVAILVGIALTAVLLAMLARYLRAKKNNLYWEVACWLLVTIGIMLRPLIVDTDAGFRADARGILIAGLAALFVLPVVMRLLNQIKTPGLSHVATPLGVGFFLNVTQLMVKTYVPGFTWLGG